MSKRLTFHTDKGINIPYFPVGYIYLSVIDTNPSEYFGGTWEQIAQGRTLIGVDINDTDFNTSKKTGGEKTHKLTVEEMPKHVHETIYSTNGGEVRAYTDSGGSENFYDLGNVGAYMTGRRNGGIFKASASGGDKPHNNLQPYFTCYMWCRIA